MNSKTQRNDSVTDFKSSKNAVTESSVNTYRPTGTARGNSYYYRFSYRDGGKVRHVHIPGGNITSPLAQSRAIIVRAKIASGNSPSEIVETIGKW